MAKKQAEAGAVRGWDTWANTLLLVLFVFFFFNLWQTVHERWLVGKTAGPGGVERITFNPEFLIPVLILLAVPVVIAAIVSARKLWRYAFSMRLGIMLTTSVLLATVLGTLVFQNAMPQEYIDSYSEPLYALFKAVHLANVFGSWWFMTLLGLLGANMVACTIHRKPWNLRMLGFVLTHSGIVLVIAGAFIGVLYTSKGAIVLGEGDSTSYAAAQEYVDATGGNFEALDPERIPEQYRIPIGAELKLDKFEEIHYKDPFMVNLTRVATRKDLRTGSENLVSMFLQQIKFDDTKPLTLEEDLGVLRVTEVFRNFRRQRLLEPDGSGVPLAEIAFKFGDRGATQIVGEETLRHPLRGFDSFHFRFAWTLPSEDELKNLGVIRERSPHSIRVYNMEREIVDEVALGVGEEKGIGDTGYTIEALRLFHDMKVTAGEEGNVVGNGSDTWLDPAMEIRIGGGDLEEPITLLLPAFRPMPHDEAMKEVMDKAGLVLQFSSGTPYELLLVGESGKLMIYSYGAGVETVDLRGGESFRPPLSRFSLRLLEAVPKARVREEYHDDAAEEKLAVKVQVRQGDRVLERVLEPSDPRATSITEIMEDERLSLKLGEKVMINLFVRGDYRKEWRSHVSLLKDGKKFRGHVIKVNEPLVHNGFYFYQQSFSPDVPYGETPPRWYTYLSVVNDPGLPVVYLGLAFLVAGIVYAFYLKPRFRRGPRKEDNDNVE